MKQKLVIEKKLLKLINLQQEPQIKKENTQILSNKNETEGITTDPIVIERIIGHYYKQVYAQTFQTQKKLTNFSKTQATKTQPRLNGQSKQSYN